MKTSISDFAIFGGKPVFASALRISPPAYPDWKKSEAEIRNIFERRYFANHGPLVKKLGDRFAQHVGCKHAISIANDGLALMILSKGLDLQEEVIVPALCRPGTVEALRWAGLVPVVSDVESDTGLMSVDAIRKLITPRTSAILGVHLWGRSCASKDIEVLCEEARLPLIFDATHGVAIQHNGKSLGAFGKAAYFSFQEGEMINCSEGACIVTNDEKLANKIRTISNFHPTHTFAQVPLRINGKMSEAQAALALVGLEELQAFNDGHTDRAKAYAKGLSNIPGLRKLSAAESPEVIVEIDPTEFGLDRNELFRFLEKENIYTQKSFGNLIPLSAKLMKSIRLAQRTLRLPSHPGMAEQDTNEICLLLHAIYRNCANIKQRMVGKT